MMNLNIKTSRLTYYSHTNLEGLLNPALSPLRHERGTVGVLGRTGILRLNFYHISTAVVTPHVIFAGIHNTFNSLVWFIHFFGTHLNSLLSYPYYYPLKKSTVIF